MSGPADLPDGFAPDAAAAISTETQASSDEFAPSGKRWADMTVGDLIAEVGDGPPVEWQQIYGRMLMAAAAEAPNGSCGPRIFTVDDTPEFVAGIVRQSAGRQVGVRPVWVRFLRPEEGKGALFVISAPHPLDGADLIAVADCGVITRGLLRDVAAWAFLAMQLPRLTVRIPDAARDVQDLARRAGFRFEGRNRDLYGPGVHGQTWAMSAADCPWLSPGVRPAPPVGEVVPFLSLKVH